MSENNNDIKSLSKLAEKCIKDKNFEEAKNYYKTILESEPENLEALYIVGFLCMKNNLYEDSLEYFNRFIILDLCKDLCMI